MYIYIYCIIIVLLCIEAFLELQHGIHWDPLRSTENLIHQPCDGRSILLWVARDHLLVGKASRCSSSAASGIAAAQDEKYESVQKQYETHADILDMVSQKARCVCSINVTSDIRPFQLTSALETTRNLRCRIQGHLSFQSQRIPVSNIEIPNLLSIRSIAGFRFGKSPTQRDSLGVAEDGRNLQTAWAPGHTQILQNVTSGIQHGALGWMSLLNFQIS